MNFVDEASVSVQSGSGGRGCVSFRRERFIPRGGPDGGDGGRGGDVIFTATTKRRTLQQFRYKRHLKARNGAPGSGRNKSGRSGSDINVEIPPGTIVKDLGTGDILFDFDAPGQSRIIAKGGRGGQGNARFKSSTHRTPRFAQPGEPGETLELQLELKLLADVGIIGFPNAGKSTLLTAMSAARPKIGAYPFTTLSPSLGMVTTSYGEPFVVADIPGLIEGAHEGAGLGIQFLKHIERTRLLLHLIDAGDIDPADPLVSYRAINSELAQYGQNLAEKPQVIVLNKNDLPQAPVAIAAFRENAPPDATVLETCAVLNEGVPELISKIVQTLDALDADIAPPMD